ncbi:MAG: TetR/AcrR family transcriptional regulator [Candidatus Rokubacteria bacterium]|nr:TetR/AcrR family transcriptional regulator [Candidatus Rokubacteria bacterium]MBI3105430.1 TetR/AcrR family transcriptional regulator [Candidatus Rokubacteria bacterium]
MATAADLLHARGYASVGVEALCQRAGVKKGSFYHFFRSKHALTLAALDWHWRKTTELVLEPAFRDDLPPIQRLGRFFDLLAKVQAATKKRTGQVRGCPFGNLSGEMSSQDERIRRKLRQIFQAIASYFEGALREAIAAGDLPGIDPAMNAQALVAYMEGILLVATAENDPALITRLGRKAIQLVT